MQILPLNFHSHLCQQMGSDFVFHVISGGRRFPEFCKSSIRLQSTLIAIRNQAELDKTTSKWFEQIQLLSQEAQTSQRQLKDVDYRYSLHQLARLLNQLPRLQIAKHLTWLKLGNDLRQEMATLFLQTAF
jgi:hypothetical protein